MRKDFRPIAYIICITLSFMLLSLLDEIDQHTNANTLTNTNSVNNEYLFNKIIISNPESNTTSNNDDTSLIEEYYLTIIAIRDDEITGETEKGSKYTLSIKDIPIIDNEGNQLDKEALSVGDYICVIKEKQEFYLPIAPTPLDKVKIVKVITNN